MRQTTLAPNDAPESGYAWMRLCVTVLIGTIGGVGMWSFVVALPAVQADFGVTRADATLPYTFTMLGFAFGGVLMGRVSDRYGIVAPIAIAAVALGLGYVAAGFAPTLWLVALAHGLLIGAFGTAATFGPLMADISQWFTRRRGLAVGIAAAGNYLAGAFWPSVVRHFIDTVGWRSTHIGIGIFCLVTMLPLAFLLRRRPAAQQTVPVATVAGQAGASGLSPNALMVLLCVAGLACCVAMSMPQVHIVAYCGDLGYGVARGAEMLSLMLAFGIASRIASGFIADRIGGVATLLLGSVLQGVALVLYMLFDGLVSLYVVSALFGLFQGGIVPSYAIIVREYFPPKEAGVRVGIVLMATLFGMALGGWMSGVVFDATGSYLAAFANGLAWNLLNAAIAFSLLMRSRRHAAAPA